jgi:ribosomal protein L12E/L44/L45/RPP1/RPP2
MISPRPVDGPVLPQRITNFRSGDKVTITAVRYLEKSIWQVSFQGKLLAVTSNVRLTAGERYTGRVFWRGNTLIFKHEGKQETGPAGRGRAELQPPEQKLVAILRQLHMPVQHEIIGSILKKAGAAKDDAKILRLIAGLYDKNIDFDPKNTEIDPLHVFKKGGGGDPNRDGRHGKERKENGTAEEPRREYTETADTITNRFREGLKQSLEKKSDSQLQLFNHMLSEHDHWIIIPVGFTVDGTVIEGSLRLKMDTHTRTVTALAVLLEADGRRYGFSIPDYDTGAPVCRYFTDKNGEAGETDKFLEIFSEKLSKLGIELDDTINEDDSFDGFEKNENTGFKTVDTVI